MSGDLLPGAHLPATHPPGGGVGDADASGRGVSALAVYARALASGEALVVQGGDGGVRRHDIGRWLAAADAVDLRLIARCTGPTLDLGCGPGRLSVALSHRGVVTLGVDVCARAVALTRARGGAAIRRDLFAPLPGEGRWEWALLADGNIGIGGAPERLLQRAAELVRQGGSLLVEVEPEDVDRRRRVRIAAAGLASHPFPWAELGAPALARAGRRAGWWVREVWDDGGRRFVRLQR